MRSFFLAYEDRARAADILDTPRASRRFSTRHVENRETDVFPLPWRHYTRLIQISNQSVRDFYEKEALRGGWTLAQLQRQIDKSRSTRSALSNSERR